MKNTEEDTIRTLKRVPYEKIESLYNSRVKFYIRSPLSSVAEYFDPMFEDLGWTWEEFLIEWRVRYGDV